MAKIWKGVTEPSNDDPIVTGLAAYAKGALSDHPGYGLSLLRTEGEAGEWVVMVITPTSHDEPLAYHVHADEDTTLETAIGFCLRYIRAELEMEKRHAKKA